jgi:hypothetical protein
MIWKILLGLARLFFDILLIWMLFGRAGKRGSARVLSDGRVAFAPDRIGLGAWPLTIVYLVWLAARDLILSHGKPWDFLAPIVLASCALSFLFLFPGTVVVNAEGLEQIYWFRRRKHIRWEEIDEIETDKQSTLFRMITITGVDGTRIVHSWLLADRPRLLLEIKQHCGEDLPPDFPREPIAGL